MVDASLPLVVLRASQAVAFERTCRSEQAKVSDSQVSSNAWGRRRVAGCLALASEVEGHLERMVGVSAHDLGSSGSSVSDDEAVAGPAVQK